MSEHVENIRRGSSLDVVLLATMALVSRILFSLPEQLADLVSVLSVVIFAWVAWKSRPADAARRSSRDRVVPVETVIVWSATLAACAFVLWVDGPARVFALPALVAVFVHAATRRGPNDWLWSRRAQAVGILYGSWLLAVDRLPWVSWAAEAAAGTISGAASVLSASDVVLGPGRVGISILVLFASHALVVTRRPRVMREYVAYLARPLVYAGVTVLGSVAFARLADAGMLHSSSVLAPFVTDYDLRLPVFLLMLVIALAWPVGTEGRRETGSPAASVSVRTRARLVAFAVVLTAASAVVAYQGPVTSEAGTVVIYDSLAGANGADVPVFDSYGLENSGMFGLLPSYLEGRGYEVQVVTELAEGDLDGSDILVIINLRQAFDETRTSWIRSFVSQGGSLLLAGDHTGGEQIRDPSNTLLEPYGVELNFDSAVPVRDDWLAGLETRTHPIFAGVGDTEMQVLVGASLAVNPPARTVVVGRDGFSDPGELDNVEEGYLGDLAFGPGERMGDVALVAEASSGAGRVLVFGDTTPFQNPALPRDYRFVDRVFGWLATGTHATAWNVAIWTSVAALVMGAFFAVATLSRGPVHAQVLLGVIIVVFGVFALPWATPDPVGDEFASPYAVVDMSHFEQAHVQRTSEAIDGLTLNLQRNGYTCFIMREFDERLLGAADILVVPSPLAPFSRSEIARIDEFVSGGGLALITAGNERPAGSRTLLNHFGVRLGTAPLGQQTVAWNGSPVHLWSAWPVEASGATGVQVIAAAWDYPVAVHVPRGKGALLVVGDASFLLNRNLEDLRSYNLHNIEFLREYIETFFEEADVDA